MPLFCMRIPCVCTPKSQFFRCAARSLGATNSWDLLARTRPTPRRHITVGILPPLYFVLFYLILPYLIFISFLFYFILLLFYFYFIFILFLFYFIFIFILFYSIHILWSSRRSLVNWGRWRRRPHSTAMPQACYRHADPAGGGCFAAGGAPQ